MVCSQFMTSMLALYLLPHLVTVDVLRLRVIGTPNIIMCMMYVIVLISCV